MSHIDFQQMYDDDISIILLFAYAVHVLEIVDDMFVHDIAILARDRLEGKQGEL